MSFILVYDISVSAVSPGKPYIPTKSFIDKEYGSNNVLINISASSLL